MTISSNMKEKGFNKSKQLIMSKLVQYQKAAICIIITVLSFLLFILFPWQETKLFTRQSKVQIRNSTLIILSIKEKCRLWREIKTSRSISFFIDRVFPYFDGKTYGSNPSKMHIKVVLPAPTQ